MCPQNVAKLEERKERLEMFEVELGEGMKRALRNGGVNYL